MARLQGKVALITGAGQGIGRAIAETFAREGAKVWMTDAKMSSAESQPIEAEFRQLDVTSETDWKGIVSEVVSSDGRIDVLVNNAGIVQSYGPILETTTDMWNRIVAVNQTGTFFGMREVIPHMLANGGGSIINLSSIWGSVGAAGATSYQASKGAVRTLTKNVAISYAAKNIRANSIHPGIIWTPLIAGQPQELNDGIVAVTPMGKMGRPDDIAYGCVYLASDESAFVTGIELNIDGGYLAQ